jgi:hypothetical protein
VMRVVAGGARPRSCWQAGPLSMRQSLRLGPADRGGRR